MIDQDLVKFLLGRPGVAALMGQRAYKGKAPPKVTLPHLVYHQVDAGRVRCLRGPTGVAGPVFQLDCWARTGAQAKALAEAIRAELDPRHDAAAAQRHWPGLMGDTRVQAITVLGPSENFQGARDGSDGGFYRAGLDATIWHDE